MLGAKLCLKVLNIWFKMYLKGAKQPFKERQNAQPLYLLLITFWHLIETSNSANNLEKQTVTVREKQGIKND